MVTEALVIPAWPLLYTKSCRVAALTYNYEYIIKNNGLYLTEVLNPQDKTDCIQDIGLAGAI